MEDMPLDGLQKHVPAAFEALEEIGAAEAHESLPCTREGL